jgi:hypothetical protein
MSMLDETILYNTALRLVLDQNEFHDTFGILAGASSILQNSAKSAGLYTTDVILIEKLVV